MRPIMTSDWEEIERRKAMEEVTQSWQDDYNEFLTMYERVFCDRGISRDIAYLCWTWNQHWNEDEA